MYIYINLQVLIRRYLHFSSHLKSSLVASIQCFHCLLFFFLLDLITALCLAENMSNPLQASLLSNLLIRILSPIRFCWYPAAP